LDEGCFSCFAWYFAHSALSFRFVVVLECLGVEKFIGLR